MQFLLLTFLLIFSMGCTAKSHFTGKLGFSEKRRIVVIGEHISPSLAIFYQKKYSAIVWFTPSQGKLSDSVTPMIKGFGPSYAMQGLIAELKSIDYTIGHWEIIIPKIAEQYFLATLKNMPSHSISHARGTVILIDSKANRHIENQVKRISDNNFFVSYEFQKY